MKLDIRLYVMTVMMMLFIACNSSSSSSDGGLGPDTECGTNRTNELVYEDMQDKYLWYDQVPNNLDHTAFETPQDFLEAAKADFDRWSFIVPEDLYNQLRVEGRYHGQGFLPTFDESNNLWVQFVYEGSPADQAGIRRSDQILTINGISVSSMPDLRAVKQELDRNATVLLEVRPSGGNTRTVSILSGEVIINTVLHRQVIDIGQTRVGYLVFGTFIESAIAELDTAFAYFRQQGIDDLILDLRYNGGGSGDVSQHLASLIGGIRANGQAFQNRIFNDRHRNQDFTTPFTIPDNAIDLSRLFVISTEKTCSASEALINGLRPFIPVIQVGDTTCGKPVGMRPSKVCDQVLASIHYRSTNANDEGGYYNGLAPDCPASDDLTRQFGDFEENSLRSALYFISYGTCSNRSRSADEKQPEIPVHMNELWGLWREISAF